MFGRIGIGIDNKKISSVMSYRDEEIVESYNPEEEGGGGEGGGGKDDEEEGVNRVE